MSLYRKNRSLKYTIIFPIFCTSGAVAQGVAAFDTSNDASILSIEPNEFKSGTQVPPEFSELVLDELKNKSGNTDKDIDAMSFYVAPRQVSGASWLQYEIGETEIGENSVVVVQSATDGEFQIFTQDTLPADGFTAAFNGDTVYFYAGIHPEDRDFENSVALEGINIDGAIWGTSPGQGMELPDIGPLGGQVANESLCGPDDRVSSNHPFVGRIMPVGCTGWIAATGKLVTAGHCIIPDQMREIEFNVPSSNPVGLARRSSLVNQYKIVQDSISFSDPYSIGNDWATFAVELNVQTGNSVFDVQGSGFPISKATPSGTITVVGYGVDDTPMSANQTQQIHNGGFVGEYIRDVDNVIIKHTIDTRGGNSGSAIIGVDTAGLEIAYGVHTNAGCMGSSGSNNATGFKNNALWTAVN